MHTILLVIHVIVSLFLIFIILIQSGKGEGLSDVFGGGSSQTTIFGTRTGNFLTKATTASAIIFMITCLSLAFLSKRSGNSVITQELMKKQAVEKVQKIMNPKEEPAKDKAVMVETSDIAQEKVSEQTENKE
ncbi:MAG: preprotein translocase subunit SecG [Candidatus Omnitrophica bacterium]|nr:preprotein translocase subunit SecG [Candidatus Omnitrophota bacterium]